MVSKSLNLRALTFSKIFWRHALSPTPSPQKNKSSSHMHNTAKSLARAAVHRTKISLTGRLLEVYHRTCMIYGIPVVWYTTDRKNGGQKPALIAYWDHSYARLVQAISGHSGSPGNWVLVKDSVKIWSLHGWALVARCKAITASLARARQRPRQRPRQSTHAQKDRVSANDRTPCIYIRTR